VPSNNFAAEMLLKALGDRYRDSGTTRSGAAVVRESMSALGARVRVADGSGLSRSDRTSPRDVVRLLQRMDDPDVATAFRASLAVVGRTGTVKRRMRRTAAAERCRVKTGTLRDVSSLAGYCRTAGGRDIAFALIFNRARTWLEKPREDRITAAIARLEGAPGTPVGEPEQPPASGGAGAP
jgi:D-alanyl-D-alanine carboxypeptidase/D-alanyl-D-alanine-endopeptidase (penicillin-binding protein 4)